MVSRAHARPVATLFAALLLVHATDLVSVCMVGDIVDVERVEWLHAP
jgi:hypothetical protein